MSTSIYFCLILLIAFTNSSPIENRAEETPEYRLPQDVAFPDNYNLELTLEENVFDINKFSGILKLTFKILKETQEIKLHANDKLQFSEVKLTGKDGKEIENINYAVNSQTEILTITTDTILSTGDYILNFIYTGDLRTDGMYGFYKSYYLDSEGQYNYLATTQFQATYARRAFPCFDEPLFKATFDIKIRHQEKFNALGNTKGERQLDADKPGFVVTTFGQTPKMSTYLVAFIVSDFDCSLDDSSVPHQICSRVEAASTRKLALKLGPQILTALEDYTGVPYADEQITKIDQVAIPDFSAGAMENWGLATYRETALLWDEQKSSNRYKQRIATVITHELAHMWFGDLVTTHWWDDTFLNEGWATYLEYFITAKVLNDWQLEKQFVLDELQPMLQIDSLQSSRPLSFKASTPAEVSSRFTSVSYNKGGSILRMVENFMGTENFKKGITKYLKDNSYNNVVPSDLWTAFQEFTADLPETLEKVMEKWVIKSGYPLLTVRVNGSNVIISQERFFTDGGVPSDSEKWYVPVTWTKSNDPNTFQNRWLLPSEDLVIQGELTDATEWIILNKQQIGYYRINYDETLWTKISTALGKSDFGKIDDLNRAQLVDDTYNLAKAEKRTYSQFLDFVKFLNHETSYYPWSSAFSAFSSMLLRTEDQNIKSALSNYILDLMTALKIEVPFSEDNDDDPIYTQNRVTALSWACRLGDGVCIQKSKAVFNYYKEMNIMSHKNLKTVVYCNALRYSENIAEDWDFLWKEFGNTRLATEQATILPALGCTTDKTILTDYLHKSINTTTGIRPQDALSVFSAVYSSNPEGVDIALEFLIEHHNKISDYYGTMNSLSSLITGLGNRFTRQEQIDKLKNFIDTTTDLPESLKTSAQIALDTAAANLKFITKFENELRTYFKVESTTTTTTTLVSTTTTTVTTTTDNSNSALSLEVQVTVLITTMLMFFQRLFY